ncbi:MAG: tetratricopeptide repeat protein [Chthoniobacteraceae bacterium]
MIAARSPLAFSVVVALGLGFVARAQQQETLDQRDMRQAEALSGESKYAEAVALYQGISQKYPTSPYIPGANLGAAVSLFFLKDYDKAAEAARKNFTAKNVPPEILERSYVLVPQILSTKAAELPATQVEQRKRAFLEAVKGFDDFAVKFPKSPEVETALYGKGRALAQIEDFEGAAAALKQGMDQFPTSPTILDTKFLRGLVLAQQGIKAAENAGPNPASTAALDEAEKAFREVIAARSDLVLINSSFMQLGDVFALKASFAERESDSQKKLNEQALEQFREVRAKDEVLNVQDRRIKYYLQLAETARLGKKIDEWRLYNRVAEKEREKLNTIKDQPDPSLDAKLKAGQIFLAMGKYDEARVLLNFAQGFLAEEDKDQKKRVAYFQCVTYAAQHIADKAVAAYGKFKTDFGKADPIAENLALLIGAIYLDPDPKLNNPDEAIKYLDEQVANFPKSKYSANAIMQKATALIALKRYDDALKALDQTLKTQTDKELLSQAEFALATVQREMGKNEEAVASFKTVRDKYPGTEQAEQAAFWVGQIAGVAGDTATALTELTAFIEKNPESSLMASALYFKARAQAQTDDASGALVTYGEIVQRFPQSEPAQPAMFEMAAMLQRAADSAIVGKPDEKPDYSKVHAIIDEFVQKYPDSDRIYAAYDFNAQLAIKEDKQDAAIKAYEDFIAQHGAKPDVSRAHLSLATIWKAGAEKLGPFLVLGKDDQAKWKESMETAIKHAEQGIEKAPESDAVSQLLDVLLKIDTLRMQVSLKKADEIKGYFESLAGKFEGKTTKPKILFALANFLADNDREKKAEWFDIMDKAYDPKLIFSPADLDRFGNALVDRKQNDKAKTVFDKLAKDYPVPPNLADPSKVTRTVGDAQSVAMAGRARILQADGKAAEAATILEELKKIYPWSAKVMEANFGIGAGLFEQKKYDEALEILANVAKSNTGSVKIRAQAMMIMAKALEQQAKYDEAINNYIKIASFFESERDIAAEGLWRGGQLLEDQATGKIVPPKPTPKPAATPKAAAKPSPKPGAAPKAAEKAEPKAAGKPAPKAGAKPAASPAKK